MRSKYLLEWTVLTCFLIYKICQHVSLIYYKEYQYCQTRYHREIPRYWRKHRTFV